jgi:Tol biopolymer transport system component
MIVLLLGACVVGLVTALVFGLNGSQVEHDNVAFDVSPNGTQVVFSSADGDLWLLNLATSVVSQITETDLIESDPCFSPDGKRIVYAARTSKYAASAIFDCLLDGADGRQLTKDSQVADARPNYSRDGKQIVFSRSARCRRYSMGGWTWDDWDVYVMGSDGSEPHRITDAKFYELNSTAVARDGTTILYAVVENRPGHARYAIYEADLSRETSPRMILDGAAINAKQEVRISQAAMSPVGEQIAFIADLNSPFHYDVVLMATGNGQPRSLGMTSVSRYNQQPRFAPDGKSIYFLAGREWNNESRPIFALWQVGVDGKGAHEIADSDLFTNPQTWKPRIGELTPKNAEDDRPSREP